MTNDATRPPERVMTDRLTLRLPEPEDAERMFTAWSSDPEVTHFLAWHPHTGVEQSADHIARARSGWARGDGFVWFIDVTADRSLVGSIAAWPGHGVSLGYVLARAAWGKGYMTEAVRAVADWYLRRGGVPRVWATCDPDNVGSARVLEKAGFDLEGTLRRWEHRPNLPAPGPHDALCYSRVTREEA